MLTSASSSILRNWWLQLKFVNFHHCAANYIKNEFTKRMKIFYSLKLLSPVNAALMQRTVKDFITFTPKCFALAVAAVSTEL